MSPILPVLAILSMAFAPTLQLSQNCPNCMGRPSRTHAKFRMHSDMCLAQSGADPAMVDSLLSGNMIEDPKLKKQIYCVMLRCKLIGKDGKLLKNGVMGKLTKNDAMKNISKVLESCYKQTGYTPEDLAWSLFRCGFDKKTTLFDYVPNTTSNTEGD